MKKVFFYGLLLPLCFSSCDKVKTPYIKGITGGTDTTVKVRKLLMEEFTGHKCGSCPPGAQTIQTLQNQYGDKLIAVSIHAGFYATVTPPIYTEDFQCNEGDDYNTFFGISANPIGMVNRKGYPSSHLKAIGEWSGLVSSILALPPDASIRITNNYNATSRVLNSTVRCEFLNALNGTYKIMLILTEDSIISPQKDYAQTPTDVLNYVHRHMLRDAISSTSWGDTLKSGLIAAGDTVIKSYIYNLPANFNGIVPDVNHCHVVAYIYNASNYEVIQAEEKKMK